MSDSVPFLDLVGPCKPLREEFSRIFEQAADTGRYIGGPMVENFETEFAGYCQAEFCVGVSSGTDAVRFALIAAGVQSGDVVLTVPNTFIATTEAITQAGAIPEFIDVHEKNYNLDTYLLKKFAEEKCDYNEKTKRLISKKHGIPVTAIVPVHLYGQIADMDEIMEFAQKYNLLVVEDACQAHGAQYYSNTRKSWLTAGSIGHAAAFSFYPGKNLGAMGEGGAITTNNTSIAEKCRVLRDHGQAQKYIHDIEGYNGRLDAIQAGILSVKLKQLPSWNEQRRQAAALYDGIISDSPEITSPFQEKYSKSVYHLYVIRVAHREALQKNLAELNIGTGLHYPVPLHLQNAYKYLGYQTGDFPVSEKLAHQILSLPLFPGITEEQIRRVGSGLQVTVNN